LPDSAGYFIVDSIIPTVQIDGDTYNHFYLTALDSAKSVTGRAEWIEGIGSLNLINTPGAYGDVNNWGALSCFFNNQTLHYSKLDSIAGCIQVYPNLSIDEGLTATESVNIFPNPASTVLHFDTFGQEIDGISVFDMFGRKLLIVSIEDISENKIDISSLPQGSFLVQFLSVDGSKTARKLIVE
ncbi:MAG: T9SS type A sorting domain-containing protein, partial [Crocinitomicaceae bacterium]